MTNINKDNDEIVQKLFDVVQTKKAEIAKIEKPNWETNCSFGYDENSSSRINLQVCNDIRTLQSILGFLIEKKNGFDSAGKLLENKIQFNWFGYTFDQWFVDIKSRVSKIEIKKKKDELESLEVRLNALISPELKAKLELEAIQKELGI